MSTKVISLIQAYAAPSPLSFEDDPREELGATLPSFFFQEVELTERPMLLPPPMKWDIVVPRSIFDCGFYEGPSHMRNVFISSHTPGVPRWVVKLETYPLRSKKMKTCFPHAEEVAYKIVKAFHWNTIPKTKTLHQFTLSTQEPKYQKYFRMMQYFVEANSEKGHPITFTFQAFVKGTTIPNKQVLDTGKEKKPHLLLPSYQKAYLLGMILGKGDARGDNTMYNPETGEVFEIDNEFLGWQGYCTLGILNCFSDLKCEEIPKEILEAVLQVTQEKLQKIQSKYTNRDLHLLSLQKQEPHCSFVEKIERDISEKWTAINNNLHIVKDTIQSLMKSGAPVTLACLEAGLNKVKDEDREKVRLEREAQEQAEKAEKQAKESERLAIEWERRKNNPPEPSRNMLGDVIDWIEMGHCVVVHSDGKDGHVYCQGEAGKDINVENLRVIYVDIANTGLLKEGEWPAFLAGRGIHLADRAFQLRICNPTGLKPRDVFHFQYKERA